MKSLAQKRVAVDDQSALKKELTALRQQMVNNSQELKVGGADDAEVWAVEHGGEPLRLEAFFFQWHWIRQVPPMLPTTSVRKTENRWSQPLGVWCLLLLNSFLLLCLFSCAVPSSPPFSLISFYFQQRIRSSWKSPHLCVKEGRTERKESWLLTCRLILNDRFSGESEKCACNGVASP